MEADSKRKPITDFGVYPGGDPNGKQIADDTILNLETGSSGSEKVYENTFDKVVLINSNNQNQSMVLYFYSNRTKWEVYFS